MYRVEPKGINIKDNDRNVPDGFLQESINLQWKDGSYKPIPDRLFTNFSDGNYEKYILHKVGDEDRVNVLNINLFGSLYYTEYILDGNRVNITNTKINIPTVTDLDSLSFTILNGIIYFMSSSQEFYYRVQWNEVDSVYEVKDMYAWKDLIAFYPWAYTYNASLPKGSNTHILQTFCGIILIRFTLVLKTGEEVLHSPIYVYNINSINVGTANFSEGDPLENIHTIINTNLEFLDPSLFDEEISAINFYASIPNYVTEIKKDTTALSTFAYAFDLNDVKGETQKLAEQPFYLIKTIEKYSSSFSDNAIFLYTGIVDTELDYGLTTSSKINMDTIASEQIMPADNFTYHRIFGKITSNNGRLIVSEPKTVLSIGHMRALSISYIASLVGFNISTEDGDLSGIGYSIDTKLTGSTTVTSRGIISYPDTRATLTGNESDAPGGPLRMFKLRSNKAHNLSCAFNMSIVNYTVLAPIISTNFVIALRSTATLGYSADSIENASSPLELLEYTSNNRLQYSEVGEFSVWPAKNSYRVGEGKIMFVGSNSIDPSNSDYLAPLIIGTTEGAFTVNYDPSGNTLIQSITKTASLPAVSKESIGIDQNLIYLSDKGLIVINNGTVNNITENYFPEYGDGGFVPAENVYPNYLLLTNDFFGGTNPYVIDDIITYLKGAVFAYDGRRKNLWCCNYTYGFSLVFNISKGQWSKSTFTFKESIEFNSILNLSGIEVYSRYLVKKSDGKVYILSGENLNNSVNVHLLTRPIKMNSPDEYKKIKRLMSRCVLYRSGSSGYFTFGLWGKQDLNKDKLAIPFVAINDNSSNSFPDNIRQDIPIGNMMGKCKTFTILQGGFLTPESSIDGFEFEAVPVENNKLR